MTELGWINTAGSSVETERIRDILKSCAVKTSKGITYMIIGIENQSDVHYAMVVRNMVQDALNYASQVEAYAKEHRKNKDLKSNEYLSGFSKTDKLIPIVTITVYWNSGKWDGPKCLHQMFDIKDKNILEFVPDYKMNLVVPDEIKDFKKFKTELGPVMAFLSCSGNRNELEKFLNEEGDIVLSRNAVDLLNTCVNAGIKITDNKGADVGMRTAWDELRDEFRMEGREEGKLEGKIEGKLEGEELMGRLVTTLVNNGRNDDVIKAATDKDFRNKLYVEYGLV